MKYTTESLINECVLNNQEAQKIFYDTYSKLLFGTIRRYFVNKEDAEELLTTSFLKIFKALHSFKDIHNEQTLKKWICRIAINESLTHKRKNKKYLNNIEIPITLEENLITFNKDEYDNKIISKILLDLIQKLPEKQRQVFNLYAIDGYSQKEICKLLTMSNSAVKSNYMRARKFLAMKLKKKGISCY